MYLVLRSVDRKLHSVTLQAYVKPLVSWIWFGGAIVGRSEARAALMPRRRRKAEATAEAPAPLLEPAEAMS